jgi:hypothetical protein
MFAPNAGAVNGGITWRFDAAARADADATSRRQRPAVRERQPCAMPSTLNTASAIQIST